MSGLESATFDGKFQRQQCRAIFIRQDSGDWLLLMQIAGKDHEKIVIPKREQVRACWATAENYFRVAMGAPEKFRYSGGSVTPRVKVEGPAIAAGTTRKKRGKDAT